MSSSSSTLAEVREAVNARFISEWPANTAYTLDNEDFDPPDGLPWARCATRHLAGGQHTLGSAGQRKYERKGAVYVQIFIKPGVGTAAADDLLPFAKNMFEGRTLDGTSVTFNEVFHRELGLVDNDRWWALIVQANFDYYEIK